ncbi:DUF6502 family protein [Piscinibacter sakaiensis]|uniref:Uncharacterized protein n=1 Tax=Piscinibacter sakaiensis TaxID=1547922 RepID=A0A0K8NVF3_PISS1|nr:DUF6502 family protein [Piscinibacter sakaiensis]GAP34376.1 hypothetical protein ISF6_4551 [Piscinibacter sakaiensis]
MPSSSRPPGAPLPPPPSRGRTGPAPAPAGALPGATAEAGRRKLEGGAAEPAHGPARAAAAPPAAAAPGGLEAALQAVLRPLAELAVARGLPHALLDELLRRRLVQVAHAAHPTLPEHRRVSRISSATGLNRREVTRLLQAPAGPVPVRLPVNELFAHWLTDPACRGPDGEPAELPRLGPAPSFESLAQDTSRDVHPRSLLEQLLRLGLAEHDEETDRVRLTRRSFVPAHDDAGLLRFLGENVGDHLSAAVANVLSPEARKPHFEQAVFGQGLPEAALPPLRDAVRRHWRALVDELVPMIEQAVAQAAEAPAAAAAAAAPPPMRRVRIGLYTFHAPAPAPADPAPAPAGPAAAAGAAAPAMQAAPRARARRRDPSTVPLPPVPDDAP